MARDPGSIWKPLPEAGAPDGHTKTQFIFHSTGTMASAAANWAYFARGDVVVESTFIVGWGPEDPTLQIMDSTDHADANGSANRRGISVEVVGDGVGGYNDWQISECVRLGLFGRAEHGIAPRIIPSEAAGGFGWHVMFGAPGPWTTVRGKVCPGGRRIQQLKDTVFPAIFSGTAPTATPAQEDDMSQEQVDRIRGDISFIRDQIRADLRFVRERVDGATAKVDALTGVVAELSAKGGGISEDRFRELLEESVVRVDVSVRGGEDEPETPAPTDTAS